MNAFESVLPLVALASPVLALVALNLYLLVDGERGTLLLPSQGSRLPAFALRARSVLPATFAGRQARSAANDPDFRRAA